MEFLNKYFGFIVYLMFTMMFFWKFDFVIYRIKDIIKRINFKGFFFNVVLVSFVFLVFSFLLFFNSSMSDIPTHMRHANDIFYISKTLAYFLYFVLVKVIGFFSNNEIVLMFSSVLILSISVWLKYVVSFKICKELFFCNEDSSSKTISFVRLVFISVILFMPIVFYPITTNLISNLSFNIWHNSTTIFLMPFALALFYLSYKFLIGERYRNDIGVLVLLITLNIVAKPAYFIVFAVVFPLFSLYKNRFKKLFWLSCALVGYGSFLLLLQYLIIYKIGVSDGSDVAISFFYIFSTCDKFLGFILNLGLSYLFPILFLVLNFNYIIKKDFYLYALISFFVALMMYLNIMEQGERVGHGNYSWQIVVTGYVWFMVSVFYLIKHKIENKTMTWQFKILIWSLGMHLLSFFVWAKYYIVLKLW